MEGELIALGKIAVILLTLLLMTIWVYYSFWKTYHSGPFVPSSYRKPKQLLKELGVINSNTNFIDLGSGDGRIMIAAAKLGAKSVTGIELNPFLTLLSKLLLWLLRISNGHVIQGDIFKQSYHNYDVVFCYLLPDTMAKLYPKLKNELKPGSKLVSSTFDVKGIEPTRKQGYLLVYEF